MATPQKPRSLPDGPPIWPDSQRYTVQRCLGRGGMGVVYEAFDVGSGEAVALKTLEEPSPQALYRFKQEFRALASVSHPNVVRPYALVVEPDARPFFTMELVSGVDFLTYVRCPSEASLRALAALVAADAPPLAHDEPTLRLLPRAGQAVTLEAAAHASLEREAALGPGLAVDYPRLRAALAQLVFALNALHDAGLVHRDVKPSNVRLTPEGRLVLVDFGLAARIEALAPHEREIVGTVGYMAPEQGLPGEPLPSCDWYSVGALLHEALFGGPTRRSPEVRTPGVPADLRALCEGLLEHDPGVRLARGGLLRWAWEHAEDLTACEAERARVPRASGIRTRERSEDARLRDAFERAREGAASVVLLPDVKSEGEGASAFFDRLAVSGEAVVFRGRVDPRERVPFRALDPLIDALSRHLCGLLDAGEDVVLPRAVDALAERFPVLSRVPGVNARATDADPLAAAADSSTNGVALALRALLFRLAENCPIALFVEGAEWGDEESGALLSEIVQVANPRVPMTVRGRVLLAVQCDESTTPRAEAPPFLRALGLVESAPLPAVLRERPRRRRS